MIDTLYKKYFQKSRSFLYPALGIPRSSYAPIQTFVGLEGKILPTDRKLVCLFQHEQTAKYEEFENKLLYSNPLFMDCDIHPGEPSLYIFDYELHDEDWDIFLTGRYSRLSEPFKNAVKIYYGESSPEYEYMDTYLYPEKYFDLYSKLLEVPKEIVASSGELCDAFNPEKEKLVFSTKILEKSGELF
jgi:hypothetical protein